MTPQVPPSLARLARGNPVAVDDERGRTPEAQAALVQILADQRSGAPPRPQRARMSRLAIVVCALTLLAVGAAMAATDPFGLWRSANPGTAQYGANPAIRVRTPTAPMIECRPASTGGFRCGPDLGGRRYEYVDRIRPPVTPHQFSRSALQRAIVRALARGQMKPQLAQRLEADLAQVPDSFFPRFVELSRLGTFSGGTSATANGRQLVPPPGVPFYLACQPDGGALSCQDLNGNENVPVGSGVYSAQPAADWVPAPPHRRDAFLPAGFSFTKAEYRLLIDMVVGAGAHSTASSSSSAAVAPGHRVARRTGHG